MVCQWKREAKKYWYDDKTENGCQPRTILNICGAILITFYSVAHQYSNTIRTRTLYQPSSSKGRTSTRRGRMQARTGYNNERYVVGVIDEFPSRQGFCALGRLCTRRLLKANWLWDSHPFCTSIHKYGNQANVIQNNHLTNGCAVTWDLKTFSNLSDIQPSLLYFPTFLFEPIYFIPRPCYAKSSGLSGTI